jgi:hypothetical protein
MKGENINSNNIKEKNNIVKTNNIIKLIDILLNGKGSYCLILFKYYSLLY